MEYHYSISKHVLFLIGQCTFLSVNSNAFSPKGELFEWLIRPGDLTLNMLLVVGSQNLDVVHNISLPIPPSPSLTPQGVEGIGN